MLPRGTQQITIPFDPFKNVSQFGSAVWPAIAKMYIHTSFYKGLPTKDKTIKTT